MRKRVRLNRKNLFNKNNIQGTSDPHSSLILSRTCEALAAAEVRLLHALGEHDLVDRTCGWEGEKREDKVRNEEACAAKSQKIY